MSDLNFNKNKIKMKNASESILKTNQYFHLDRTPHFFPPEKTLESVDEKEVENKTESVFSNFTKSLQNNENHSEDDIDTPKLTKLNKPSLDPDGSVEKAVGMRLAEIGDQVHKRYRSEFRLMASELNLTSENAFETFSNIASRLFSDGPIHWGKIITLFCFGYELAKTFIKNGVIGFLKKIIEFLIKFLVSKGITRWIGNQGGWKAFLYYSPKQLGLLGVTIVTILAFITTSCAIMLK